jgi:alkanesulfonate monooxygenase SsuD/methylene tetrahydromethanopterin reductase-like flavin-dependent oxidoreductase (luciferase family)
VLPVPVQRPGPPVWVGGQSRAAIRRAVAFADVWDAPYVEPDALRAGVAQLHGASAAAGRDPASIEVSVRGLPADDVTPGVVERYATLGVSHLGVMLPVRDRGLALEALHGLASRVAAHLRS